MEKINLKAFTLLLLTFCYSSPQVAAIHYKDWEVRSLGSVSSESAQCVLQAPLKKRKIFLVVKVPQAKKGSPLLSIALKGVFAVKGKTLWAQAGNDSFELYYVKEGEGRGTAWPEDEHQQKRILGAMCAETELKIYGSKKGPLLETISLKGFKEALEKALTRQGHHIKKVYDDVPHHGRGAAGKKKDLESLNNKPKAGLKKNQKSLKSQPK